MEVNFLQESPASDASLQQKTGRRTRQPPRRNTRTSAACDACRESKTRCDSARPACSKCVKLELRCAYPDTDPVSILESWGSRILGAIERQERMLSTTLLGQKFRPEQYSHVSSFDEDDLESTSRNDALNTPITGADMILSWPIFPKDKPVTTFPGSSFAEKPDRFPPGASQRLIFCGFQLSQTRKARTGGQYEKLTYYLETITNADLERMMELREIFMTRIYMKCPILDADELHSYFSKIAECGVQCSASSCLVMLVCALAAIWGRFPDPDTRTLPCKEAASSPASTYVSLSVPADRMIESLKYLDMARKMMGSVYLDDSLLGVQCYCLSGIWYLYNIEPIQGWKMFRTASMLWQTYNLKQRKDAKPRSEQEQSLEQRLYWTCLKSECEIRYELADLPSSNLSLSDFPFSFPTFSVRSNSTYTNHIASFSSEIETASSYYFLAEISLRRLMNRIRNAVQVLSPDIDKPAIDKLTFMLSKLEDQLQQWIDCLPSTLKFYPPLQSQPPPDEHELVRLVRERYVEGRELLCRAFLYLCMHARLDPEVEELYGKNASEALLLAVYRVQTENPFFRHSGSWGSCRIRFNHALCLIAAFRAKSKGINSARYINLPYNWADSVYSVIERLKIWGEEGAGIKELGLLLEWLMDDKTWTPS